MKEKIIIDLHFRKVGDWRMNNHMPAPLICDALTIKTCLHRPKAGLTHHSDRGSQSASKASKKSLKAHKYKGSMSRKGDCWDNDVVESFFGTLKQERVHWQHYQTRYEAQLYILDYISMFYISHRLQSYFDPNQLEIEITKLRKVASLGCNKYLDQVISP